jgi:hypothetical protein
MARLVDILEQVGLLPSNKVKKIHPARGRCVAFADSTGNKKLEKHLSATFPLDVPGWKGLISHLLVQ